MNKAAKPAVFFANPVFGEPGLASTVELAKWLSTSRPVVFVNNPLTLTDLLKSVHRPRIGSALTGKPKSEKLPNGGYILVMEAPIMLPINALSHGKIYLLLRAWNARRYARRIQRFLDRQEMTSCIGINAFNPHYMGLELDRDRFSKHIYYCYDNLEAAAYLGKHGKYLEPVLAERVDEIIVSSQGLRDKFDALNKPLHWIPNGMEPSNFSLLDPYPTDGLHLVYIGAIDDRLDYRWIEGLLDAFKEATLTLVGPVKSKEARRLGLHDRVKVLGSFPAGEVRSQIGHCNVGLIPFAVTEFTKFIYPLKINEYLSMGMAVLTTEFAPLDEFYPMVRPQTDLQGAIQELTRIEKEALTTAQAAERSAFAQKNSWQARGAALNELLHG